ncbi:hypothetical protein TrRE_jg11716 [Triparma retinervis]|uniref:Thiamin pyrophosphokinase catalytic domain-containing protein n=1 Tax=Triparma retinervis TaxID=2557542 RepID=A0A9W7EG82_9STRA|nr:hypothetical protein TrRE_jg11716 [Triparma retinervis]
MPPMLAHLFGLCSYVICADGGANRLYDLCGLAHSSGEELKTAGRHLPDAVKGDMDSIRPDVRRYYESRGVSIIEDGSVDLNDLEKCLWQVKDMQEGRTGMFDAVCIYGGWGGRFDQSMSSLSALFKVTTDGLRWNLNGDELCFGKLVSSSNEYSPGIDVTVRCNNFLAWTTQITK